MIAGEVVSLIGLIVWMSTTQEGGATCNDDQENRCRKAATDGQMDTLSSSGQCVVKQYVHYTHICAITNYIPNTDFCCCIHQQNIFCCRYQQSWNFYRCVESDDVIDTLNKTPSLELLLAAMLSAVVAIGCLLLCCIKCCCYQRHDDDDDDKGPAAGSVGCCYCVDKYDNDDIIIKPALNPGTESLTLHQAIRLGSSMGTSFGSQVSLRDSQHASLHQQEVSGSETRLITACKAPMTSSYLRALCGTIPSAPPAEESDEPRRTNYFLVAEMCPLHAAGSADDAHSVVYRSCAAVFPASMLSQWRTGKQLHEDAAMHDGKTLSAGITHKDSGVERRLDFKACRACASTLPPPPSYNDSLRHCVLIGDSAATSGDNWATSENNVIAGHDSVSHLERPMTSQYDVQ